mgnify:CR=1 FL=1
MFRALAAKRSILRFLSPLKTMLKVSFARGALERKGAKAVDIVKFGKFITETERAGSGDHGIIQLDPAKIHT